MAARDIFTRDIALHGIEWHCLQMVTLSITDGALSRYWTRQHGTCDCIDAFISVHPIRRIVTSLLHAY